MDLHPTSTTYQHLRPHTQPLDLPATVLPKLNPFTYVIKVTPLAYSEVLLQHISPLPHQFFFFFLLDFSNHQKKLFHPSLLPLTAKLILRAVYTSCLHSLCSGCHLYHPASTSPVKVPSASTLRNLMVNSQCSLYLTHRQHFPELITPSSRTRSHLASRTPNSSVFPSTLLVPPSESPLSIALLFPDLLMLKYPKVQSWVVFSPHPLLYDFIQSQDFKYGYPDAEDPQTHVQPKLQTLGCLFHISPWMINRRGNHVQNRIPSFLSNLLQTQPSLSKLMATLYFLLLRPEILIILDFSFSHIAHPFIQRNPAGLPSKPII